tara:strand:- start:1374 stop:2111 length:738 start_codon:yes stop_codon:yes gene_type:complete
MKLTKALQKYNYDPSPNDIINIIFDFENGLRHQTLARKYGTIELIIRKIVDEYGYHSASMTTPRRREHWEQNRLWDYMVSLSERLGKDVSVEYNAESYANSIPEEKVWQRYRVKQTVKMYDPNDSWNKHITKKNKMNYNGQKSMALKRGIAWEFNSFEEWLLWWLQTGKFDQRGVTNEHYQMCRYNDTGPYSPSNCYCATGKENKELYLNDKEKLIETGKKISKALKKHYDSKRDMLHNYNINQK